MGLLLCIIAVILIGLLFCPAIFIGTLISITNHTGNKYYKDVALSLDQFGNVLCQHLFNLILIQRTGYRFGNVDETISSVLGKNQRDKTLATTGKLIAGILDLLDKDHCLQSIDE